MGDMGMGRQDPSSQEKLLLYRLLGSTVPFRSGGGAVFPNGFPGKGYLLDEWQFERYRARLGRMMLDSEAKQRRRIAIFLYLAFLAAIVFGPPLLKQYPPLMPYLDDRYSLVTVLAVGLSLTWLLRTLVLRPAELLKDPNDAPQIGRFAFLRRRSLGALASSQVNITAQQLKAVVGFALCAVSLWIGLSINAESLLLAVMMLLWSCPAAYYCYVHWSFRRQHGRAPTEQDLAPV